MSRFHSLVLLSVGNLALSLCSVAVLTDSIPTLTATSVSYAHESYNHWTVSGDSFSIGGTGGNNYIAGFANIGQSISNNDLRLNFGADRGPGGYTTRYVTDRWR